MSADTRLAVAPGIDLRLRFRKADRPKGTLLLVHGVAEHLERYAHVERRLLDAGWSFFAYDHRGHGRSGGRRVHVDRFDDYVDDLQKVYDEAKAAAGGGKVFVWGHSMGSLVAFTWAALRRPTVWGVVATAPPFKLAVKVPMAKIVAAKVLSRIVPSLALANEVDPAALARDPAVGAAYVRDPLVERKATVRWGAEFLAAIDRINARAGEMETPYLILHGGADAITSAAGSAEFHGRTASTDKSLTVYDGWYHELHNDPEKERMLSDLVRWLDTRA